jgi:hypothetical protein
VHAKSAPTINPNNRVMLRSLMSILRLYALNLAL